MSIERRGKQKQIKETMYLFFEGYSTERKYFDRIENIRSRSYEDSIHLILQPIGRDLSKMGKSHPWDVYDYMQFYEQWVRSDGKLCQYDLFLTNFLHAASKQNKGLSDLLYPYFENNDNRLDIKFESLNAFKIRLINILKDKNAINEENRIKYVDVNIAFDIVKKEMMLIYPNYDFNIDVDKYLRPKKSVGNYCFGMVIDRDQKSNDIKDLQRIMEKCKKNGYSLIITNPNFEFWLSLHTKNYDKDEMIEDIRNLIKMYNENKKTTKEERNSVGPMRYIKDRYKNYDKDPNVLDVMNEKGLKTAVDNLKELHETDLDIVIKELSVDNLSSVGSNILDIILK